MSIMLRPAEGSDVEQICGIERVCFSDPWSEQSFLSNINDITVAWDEESHAVLGFLVLLKTPFEAEILNVAVATEARRKGIGNLLIGHALENAGLSGCEAVFLEVRESNNGARSLYEKNGFTQISVRKNYYSNPKEDAIIMTRVLS